jgi:hypothetical protein
MRLVIGILISIGAGAMALADAPPSTPPSTPAQTVASTAQTVASTATSSPATAASAPHEATAAPDPREKLLKLKGYKLEMRHGEKLYCRSEEVLGSRLAGRKVCGSVEELLEREHASQEMAGAAQRTQLNPTGK